MSLTTESISTVKPSVRENDNGVKQHYQKMLRRRVAWIAVIIAAILLSLVIDFTLAHPAYRWKNYGKPSYPLNL